MNTEGGRRAAVNIIGNLMEQVGNWEYQSYCISKLNRMDLDSFEIISRRDSCRSVDWYEQFDNSSLNDEDFEVKIDEELIHNAAKRQTLKSCVLSKFKVFNANDDWESKRRISVKRQRKKLVNFSGFLLKKSGSIFHGWQKRFVYLSENRLWYYKDKNDLAPCGIINLGIVDAKIKITKKNKLWFSIIIIEGWKREFKFKAKSQEERNQWGAEIIKHMYFSTFSTF